MNVKHLFILVFAIGWNNIKIILRNVRYIWISKILKYKKTKYKKIKYDKIKYKKTKYNNK